MTRDEEHIQKIRLTEMLKNWCNCDTLESIYDIHIAPNTYCLVCKIDDYDDDHYHCGTCLKLTQIG